MRRIFLSLALLLVATAPGVAKANVANVAGAVEPVANIATPPASKVGVNMITVSDAPSSAQPTLHLPGTDPNVMGASGKALIKLFILAVILESALALLFNWKPFVAVFDGRGIKPLLSFVAALIVTFVFKPESFAELLAGYGSVLSPDALWLSKVLEAMVIAGGSSGVNNMLVALGFRTNLSAAQVQPKPKPTEAWIAVALHRHDAVGPVLVEVGQGTDPATVGWEVAGTIVGKTAPRSIFAFELRDFARFPTVGGWSVKPDLPYLLRLTGQGQDGRALESTAWGPHALMSGAIVDIDLSL